MKFELKAEKSNLITSFLYIVVVGLSKGLYYLIVLYLAWKGYKFEYLTILLLLSYEQFLGVFLPFNSHSIIYSRTIKSQYDIFQKIFSASSVYSLLIVFLNIIFSFQILEYFEIDSFWILLAVICNAILVGVFNYVMSYLKLKRRHKESIQLSYMMLTPVFIVVLFYFIIPNKIEAFFYGKALGLIFCLIYLYIKFPIKFPIKFYWLSKKEFKFILNLLGVMAMGWIMGLGFMNVAKIYASQEELLSIGYTLNIYSIFVLISIGLNSVYQPEVNNFLKIFEKERAIKISKKYFGLYILMLIGALLIYFLAKFINFGGFKELISCIPYAILIFFMNIFQWIAQPYYMSLDRFDLYCRFNFYSIALISLVIILMIFTNNIYMLLALFLLHFFRGGILFAGIPFTLKSLYKNY